MNQPGASSSCMHGMRCSNERGWARGGTRAGMLQTQPHLLGTSVLPVWRHVRAWQRRWGRCTHIDNLVSHDACAAAHTASAKPAGAEAPSVADDTMALQTHLAL